MNIFKLAAILLPVSLLGSCVYLPDMVPDMPYSGSLKTESPTPAPKPKAQNSGGFFGQISPMQQQVQQQPTPKTPGLPAATPPPVIPPSATTAPSSTPGTAPAATAVPGAVVQPVTPAVQAPQPSVRTSPAPAPTTITTTKVQPVIAPRTQSTTSPKVTPAAPKTTSAASKVTTPKPVSTTPAPASSATPAPKPAPAAKPAVKAADTPPVASRVPGDPFRVYNPYEPSKTILIKGANGQPFPSGKKLKIQGTDKYFIVP